MRHQAEMSPLFQLGRSDNGSYDDLDEYDDNWDLRDVPLEPRGGGGTAAQHPAPRREKETELTSRGSRARQRSLHHDEEEAVLCPLVFCDEDDPPSSSELRRSSRTGGGRRRRPIKSTVMLGTAVCVVVVLALAAWFPSISRHATSFKSSVNESRQLASLRARRDPDDQPALAVTFPSSAVPEPRRKVSTTLDAIF
jgi:hypothetical protein